ncbi:MAG: hypothetical protein DKM23_06935 [Candidatus Melainabacteria bacterium]|nr:MAG: hypothetical protein DKM23_06935 [Candidatus Melainabacteria bacterium]
MFNFSILKAKFSNVDLINESKVVVNSELVQVLDYLKNTPEFDFDILTSIIAIDLTDKIELIYQLMSSETSETLSVSYYTDNHTAPTATDIYKSANFDECEIFDLFGVEFIGNKNLKRLLMPENWVGHPLLKSYVQNDERLVWND